MGQRNPVRAFRRGRGHPGFCHAPPSLPPLARFEDPGATEARKEEAAAREKANKDLASLPPEDRSKALAMGNAGGHPQE